MVENPFTAFIDLVTYDAALRALQQKRLSLISEQNHLQSTLSLLERNAVLAKARLADLRKEVDKLERDLHELDEQLSDKQRRLSLVNTPKEYMSLQQEIEVLEQNKRNADDALLGLWSALEEQQKVDRQREKTESVERDVVHTKLRELQQNLAELEQEIEKKQRLRVEKEIKTPDAWREKYAMMLTRVENPVVPVENASCSACFYPIAQQDLAALMRHKLLECKGCYRILYYL